MKKWLAIALLCMAITSHAAEGLSCSDLQARMGLKPGEMLSSEKLALIQEKSKVDKAMTELAFGLMPVCGIGVPKDVDAGIRIWEKAVAEGNEKAALFLAGLYSGYLGVPYDQTKFLYWMEIGAKQGQADSQSSMGALHAQGSLLKKDDVAAERWWLKAAAQGHETSYTLLGNFYFSRQMYGEALRWFNLGATLGNADAQVGLGALYSGGFGVTRDHGLAMQWWNTAAEKTAPSAQFAIGTAHANGWGVPRDEAQAVRWFQLAAAQGSPAAQEALAHAYEFGLGVSPDTRVALQWRTKAADSTRAGEQQGVARLYPDCCTGDVKQALASTSRPYRLDAESGNSESQLILARFLQRNKSTDEAILWYQRAIAQGNAVAMEELGTLYFAGIGLPVNVKLGLKFMRQAAERGRALAQARLGDVYEKGIFVRQSLVVAYALYSAANTAGKTMSNLALEESMSEAEVNRAKQLIRDMAVPGNFLMALDKASAP